MKILGMRFCKVAKSEDAKDLAEMLVKLGVTERKMDSTDAVDFQGAIFPIEHNQENSWIEIWPAGENMPEMVMLQIVVDDADAFAANARENGLDPKGPDDAHGERIYYLEGSGGLPIAFQSKIS